MSTATSPQTTLLKLLADKQATLSTEVKSSYADVVKHIADVRCVSDAKTENGAPAFSTTDNPILDAFALFVRSLEKDDLEKHLETCWKYSPEQTLQLIAQTRDCRNGKGEKLLGQLALSWLRRRKPVTYLLNLPLFIEVGYLKDLLQVLELNKNSPTLGEKDFVELEVFADQLKRDLKSFEEKKSISLAAKWAPTEGSKYTFWQKKLAKLLYPNDSTKNKKYRQLLSKLRSHLRVVERHMCLNQWNDIKFEQVPSIAHSKLKKAFTKHEEKRYQEYLEAVKKGTKEIKTTGIQPHELVSPYLSDKNTPVDETTEVQWKTLIEKLQKAGNTGKSIAVADVSGSMTSGKPSPLSVSVALSLVCSQLAKGPFKDNILTFSQTPQLHCVVGSNLKEKVNSISNAAWEMNTNIQAVFELLLNTAKMHNVKQEDMIETVFVFTDMQFDAATGHDVNEKDAMHACIKDMYEKANYVMPKLVFWNLRAAESAFPIKSTTTNTALVSGFSSELLKLFMDGETFTPATILKKALGKYIVTVHPSEK